MYLLFVSFLMEVATAFRAGSRHIYISRSNSARRKAKTKNQPSLLVSQRFVMPEFPSPLPREHRRRVRRAPPGYLSIGALAAMTPVSRSALYNYVRDRKLPACKWRGRLIVSEAAAREFFAVTPLDPDISVDAEPLGGQANG